MGDLFCEQRLAPGLISEIELVSMAERLLLNNPTQEASIDVLLGNKEEVLGSLPPLILLSPKRIN